MDCRSVAFELLHLLDMARMIAFNLIVWERLVIWGFITFFLWGLFFIGLFLAIIVIFRRNRGWRRSTWGRKHLSFPLLHRLLAACIFVNSIFLCFLAQICQSDLPVELKFLRVFVGGTDTPFHKVLLNCLSIRHRSLARPLLPLFLTSFSLLSYSSSFITSRVVLGLILYLARCSCLRRLLRTISDILTLFLRHLRGGVQNRCLARWCSSNLFGQRFLEHFFPSFLIRFSSCGLTTSSTFLLLLLFLALIFLVLFVLIIHVYISIYAFLHFKPTTSFSKKFSSWGFGVLGFWVTSFSVREKLSLIWALNISTDGKFCWLSIGFIAEFCWKTTFWISCSN